MGERPFDSFLKHLRTKISKQMWIAFWTACGVGVVAHFVALSNILNNYDSITQLPAGVGTGATSGRWLLTFLEMVQTRTWYDYNIPFFNLFVGIILIAISAGLIVNHLSIENNYHAFLVGSIMIVFPPVTSMFFSHIQYRIIHLQSLW